MSFVTNSVRKTETTSPRGAYLDTPPRKAFGEVWAGGQVWWVGNTRPAI